MDNEIQVGRLPETMSKSIGALSTALNLAQADFETAKKNCYNPHYKSNFADLAEIIRATKVGLEENGLSYTQLSLPIDGKQYLITKLMHKSGEWIQGYYLLDSSPDKFGKVNPQVFAGGVSYARRYGLQSILGIAAEDDDDGNRASQPNNAQAPQGPRPFKTARERIEACKSIDDEINNSTTIDELNAVYTKNKAIFNRLRAGDDHMLYEEYFGRFKDKKELLVRECLVMKVNQQYSEDQAAAIQGAAE